MKILHTADWHIGATWEGVDRSSDLLGRALPDIINIALNEKVDIVLVAGDIFERQTNEAIEKAAQTLGEPFKELLDANIDIALLPGNHDSYPLFRFLRSAIKLVGGNTNERGQLHVLNSAFVSHIKGLQFLHIPYMRADQIENLLNSISSESPNTIEGINQEIGRKLDQIALSLRGKIDHSRPALMTYHGVVKGSTVGPDEQAYEFTYNQDYMLSPESLLFNDQVPGYNALGHIHKCQELNGAVPTWYAGSIDRLDRGEKTYSPSVILVTYHNNNCQVEVEPKELPRPTPFLDEDIKDEKQLKALHDKLGSEGCNLALGRVTLSCDPVEAYILDQAVRDAFPRLKGIKGAVRRSRSTIIEADSSGNVINLNELINPVHTIRSYISENMPQERQEGLFNALAIVESEIVHVN